MASRPFRRGFSVLAILVVAPVSLGLAFGSGCGGGGGGTGPTGPTGPSGSVSATASPSGATGVAADAGAPADALVASALDAAPGADGNLWQPLLADAGAAASDAPPPPCWKGFAPTGNAEADVADLGSRCAQGMSPLVPPVKHTFKAGESKSVPVPIVPGCYRVIAVGGKGVKDVDLALKDAAGKIVAADMTPDDVFPMIHPNKEFCTESVQFLNLVISVKKGSGDVAGGVWKR